jgi:pimeloyl-ACP methyl ester carboxylesterase
LTNHTIQYQQSAIFYRSIGKGKKVMLLHGFAEDGTIWENQIAFLKNDFRVLIPDIPGSGQSELIQNGNIEIYAEVIRAILADDFKKEGNTGSEAISIIGHSMGGYIAMAFAEKYPQHLTSLGLFHSTAFADNEDKKIARTKAILFIKEHGSLSFLQTSIPGLFTENFTEKNSMVVNKLVNHSKEFNPLSLIQYYEAMIQRPDRREVLKEFQKPILFIIGEKDNVIPLESILKQCYLPAESHIHILEKSAHMGMLEETEKSNQIIYDFLKIQ